MKKLSNLTKMAPNNARVYPTVIALLMLLLVNLPCISQDSTAATQPDKKRLNKLIIGSGVGYVASMAALYQLWYTNSEHQPFAFFNDNAEWKQVDKFGHFGSAFYLSYAAHRGLRWAGVAKKKSDAIAAASGFLVLLPIEIFDGFSAAYGASTGDLIANAGGAALFFTQQAIWDEVRIYPKFSFHTTGFAAQRPAMLGDHYSSQLFKDYNGQTYWFSLDMEKFLRFPSWLNIAVGYGAENMVYARDYQNERIGLQPFRQYYLSLDFDLTAIKTRSKAVKTLIFLANIIKLPAPTLSLSNREVKFHPLYF